MKSKPVSHKMDNTFKFQSFGDRLSKINVSVLHNIKRGVNGIPTDEDMTYFAVTLEKWFDLNCSQHFDDLRQTIGSIVSVQSLPQIIHRKEELINILVKNLNIKDNLALNVVLELIVAIARDLNTDFYQYFKTIFMSLIDLIQSPDIEIIENTFICLTFLFKYLQKYIINEFDINYSLFQTLLTSKKEYIRVFTAESVSFLVRKAQNKSIILDIMFKSVAENPKLIEGVGQLLFESVKGLNHNFHSCAQTLMPLLVEKYLVKESEGLDKTIGHMFEHLVEYISKDNSELLWKTLLIDSNSQSIASKKCISLLVFVISFKKCAKVINHWKLVQYLVNCLQNNSLDENHKNLCLDSLSYLLINCFQLIPNEDIQFMNTIIFSSDCLTLSQTFNFAKSVFSCLPFERIILPSILTFVSKHLKSNCESKEFLMSIRLLSQLMLSKRHRPIYGSNVKSISKYVLKFDEDICQTIIDAINTTQDLKTIWSAFVCLPNLVPITDESNVSQIIAKTVTELETRFNGNYSENRWFGYIIVEAVIALIILKNGKPIEELSPKLFTDLINANPLNTEILQSFDLYLSYNKEFSDNGLNLNILETIYNKTLELNLSSFCKTKRLLTLHVLTLFDPPLPPSEDINSLKYSVFKTCFNAESVSTDLRDYRSKLKFLQNLDYSYVKPTIPLTTSGGLNFDEMPIHYLLGVLHENLSVLWQPTQRLLDGYAKGYPNKKLFFNILVKHLRQTSQQIYENKSFDNYYEKDLNNYFDSKNYSRNTFPLNSIKPDFANHRLLVLKTIDLFPEVIEPSNREFIPTLFEFLDKEMSFHLIFGQNSKENIGIEDTIDDSVMELDSNEDQINNELKETKPTIGRKTLWKTLFTYLSILSKFKNPKALYREKDLLQFYLNLLSSPDSEAQKSAFNCISSYNNSYLVEFKQNFLRLIDEKTFKSEIYSFILNTEDNNVLKSENRSNVVPLVLRILYGKLMASNGTKRHGKNNADFRRSIILKVLSAFNENEMILFLDFIFAPILEFIEKDYNTLNEIIKTKTDIKQFISLRQFQALVRTLHFVLKHFGVKWKAITSYVYKVVVVVSTLVSHLLQTETRGLINEYSIIRLKDIRSNCFKVTKSFFESFDTYCYSSEEIDALFQSLIWPMLPNLDTESLTTPSPLLSLFVTLSQNSRYFKMFAKSHPLDKDLTPIQAIIKLYHNPKAQTPAITAVTEVINNLLVLDNFTESNDQNIPELEVNETNVDFNSHLINDDLRLGTVLLLPFSTQILNRIRENFENRKKQNNNKNKKNINNCFDSKEINILSLLSPFVTQSDQSLQLILLLIDSIDVKKTSEEQKELQTIQALTQLVKNINDIKDIKHVFKGLVPLFGVIANCMSRTELCSAFQQLVKTDTQLSSLSQLVCDLNSYNPKFPEEPNYPKRVEAFKDINSKMNCISKNDFNYEFISIVVYNCIHFITFCSDLAIRESALNTINVLLRRMMELDVPELFNTFAIKLLLYTTISKGFRNKSETIRHELIELLLSMIEICGHNHPVLQQLALLCNKEDEEIDFWLNIKHIQLHRRARALSRLARSNDLLKSLSNRIIADFLIPLTTNFLNDIHYTKHPSLVNASIESIGAFAKYIPWNRYYIQLKHYVNQLIAQKGDQKINIKIISSLLENFSFVNETKTDDTIIIEDEEEDEEEVENNMYVNSIEVKPKDKIYDSTVNRLLPLLNKCLHQKSQIDFAFDSMKSEFSEDEDIQRVAIALAIIKLLKAMNPSPEVLKANISSVFLRLCQFLQSRAQSIRDSARNTFIKVMQCLGPKYLVSALKELKSTLSKGYQKHVFVYTVHSILSELRPQLKTGDLDNCLDSLLDICCLELFGNLSEEKEVTQITTKLKEAKKTKSYEIFQIIANFVSEKGLTQLLMPLKTTLSEAHNHKVLHKVSQSLSKVGQGLIANTELTEKSILLFIYGLSNDLIPDLRIKYEDKKNTKDVKNKVKTIDSFLISRPIYQRAPKVTKIGETANSHIMIEFALNCFLALIKQNRMNASNAEHISLLDPFIVLLKDLLESKDPKLTTSSLQCLHILYTKFSVLPSFGKHSENIMKLMFVLLHKYAKFGVNDRDGDNVQMVLLCFKTISLFIKDRTDVTINEEQMSVLLSYVDQDLHNDSRKSTVFLILKAILSRKYDSLVLHRIMKKISEMAINSDIDYIRSNCNQLCVKYLTEYSSKTNTLKKRINFFVRHLEYEKTTGRESASSVVKQVISGLSDEYLHKNIAIFFVPLSSRLVNESSNVCKKLIADSIVKLLNRITETDRNLLFNEMVIPWIKSEGILQRLLASHLCSLYITVENKAFMRRLPQILSYLKQQLDPNRYNTSKTTDNDSTKSTDSLVYQHLNLFIKLMKTDSQFIKKSQYIDEVNVIFDYILTYHSLHPHLWVRVISTQIFGQLFSQYSTECLATSIASPSESYEYLISDTKEKLSQMVSKFCLLFRDIYSESVLSDQLIKNLVFISRVFIQSSVEDNNHFKWISNKMIFEVKYELKNCPNFNKKRILIFKWMAAVAVEMTSDMLEQYLPNFLPLLCREESQSDKMAANEDNELQVLTKQVLQLFKSLIGTEKFSDYYTNTRNKLTLKRLQRKNSIAVQGVNDVIKSAKRKIEKHNKNNVSKKRKISNFKQN